MNIILKITILLSLFSCVKRNASVEGFYLNLGGEPSNLNPITSNDGYASDVFGYIFDSLLTQDIETYEFKPSVAESWEVSKDKTQFKFKIREGVKFHDGKPLTAEDVKFSFDVIFDDRYNTATKRPYYEGIKEVKILDPLTVVFVAKDQYWRNFEIAAGMTILPKHFYGNYENKKLFTKKLIGSGPYIFDQYHRGSRFVLKRNADWFGFQLPGGEKEHRFNRITLKLVKDPTVSLEMLKKHRLDYIGLQPEEFVKKTNGAEWGKSVFKVKTQNATPKGYNFIGWNMRHPILKDRNVRKALFHLVNRELMIKKFEHNLSVPANSPIHPGSPYYNSNLKAVEFNPKLALKILKEVGWSDSDDDGLLDKKIDGIKTPFKITILEPYQPFSRYLTVFKEDARKMGIEIEIKLVEWNSFIKLVEERKFDAIRMAWSGAVDWEPKQIWHSTSIKQGSNFVGFSFPEIDKIIDDSRLIHDREERIKLLRIVENKIINEYPYVFFTFKPNTLYGHTSRIEKEKDTYQYGIGQSFWNMKKAVE
jgi:ABC-type transport system substrate-binding protein